MRPEVLLDEEQPGDQGDGGWAERRGGDERGRHVAERGGGRDGGDEQAVPGRLEIYMRDVDGGPN